MSKVQKCEGDNLLCISSFLVKYVCVSGWVPMSRRIYGRTMRGGTCGRWRGNFHFSPHVSLVCLFMSMYFYFKKWYRWHLKALPASWHWQPIAIGELFVAIPAIEATAAFLDHLPPCSSSVLECWLCFRVLGLAQPAETHGASFCVIFSHPGLPSHLGYMSPWPHPLPEARTK